ncbi:MAG: MarR family transcriptional regulator [bacterium]|nr:MarR family transcriptional regulator [bacterium]
MSQEDRPILDEIRRFRSVLRRFQRLTHAQLKNCCAEVTLAQCLVLLEIDEKGQLSVSQLASRLRLDSSTLSRTIEGLVQRRLLERLREDKDRRVVRMRLTPEGDSVCRSIHAQNDGHFIRIFERIPASRRGKVIEHFETLVQAFLDDEVEAISSDSGSPASSEKEVSS